MGCASFPARRRNAMSLPKTEKIWHNGKCIRWDDATIHVLSHVVSYGSAVFEGVRCYETAAGPGHLPPSRTHAAPAELRAHLSHGDSLHAGRTLPGGPRSRPRQQSHRLLHPAHRPARLRRRWAWTRATARRGLSGLLGMGKVSGRDALAQRASMSASAPGTAPRPIRFRKWPRPPRTT